MHILAVNVPGAAANPLIEPQMLGAMGLVLAATGVTGMIVYRLLPPGRNAYSLACLAAFATVALLAYAGVQAAGAIMWVCLVALLILWVLTALANS